MSTSREHLKYEGSKSQAIIAGATAGLVARFFVAPLDVVKIRLQLQSHSANSQSNRSINDTNLYQRTLPTFKHIIRSEGISGLWKGNIAAEWMYVTYSAIQFTTYRAISLSLRSTFNYYRIPNTAESFVAGAGAGAVATTVTYPLDLLRTRFAAQGIDKVYLSLSHSIREIYKCEGQRGFFQGLGVGVSQIIPYMGIFFAAYESLRLPLMNLNLPFSTGDGVAGIISSVLAKTAVFPLDLIRKRFQVQGPTRLKYVHKNIPICSGTLNTLRIILMTEGVKGLYRGLTISLLKAAPTGAITIWTYERVLRLLVEIEATAASN